jgi:NAD(P)-dependent dehydrogenase (short-subunit alcohol dehydrogenase family)
VIESWFGGRVAVVTGAGSGMGREVTRRLAAVGARVFAVDRDSEALAGTLAAAAGSGGEVVVDACDVSDPAQVTRSAERARAELGDITILVNCAGIGPTTRPLEAISDPEWRSVLDVNLTGTFNWMRAVLPGMKAHRRGKIVNVSSTAGRSFSTFGGAHYTASKAAVIGLTRHRAFEAAPDNVNVNAIAPGTIDTPLLRGVADQERIDQEARKIPLRRVGTVVDIADLVLFLASPPSDYITGATIDINGGELIL